MITKTCFVRGLKDVEELDTSGSKKASNGTGAIGM
jgi:hypothetical protein